MNVADSETVARPISAAEPERDTKPERSASAAPPRTNGERPAAPSSAPPSAPRPEPPAAPAEQGPECPAADHVPGSPGCLTAEAFDERVVREFELTVDAADVQRMAVLASSQETENTYVPAQLVVDGEDLGMVGVRYKGAFGTLQTCIGGDYELVCDKMSYKVKFDEFDEDKRWKAIKKVNLHSMRVDDTLMHEHLAYAAFRKVGIAASRASHAQVRVNGELKGVFALTEAPDGRFTADRFAPNGDGNLYKEVWPFETDAEYYEDSLETNKDEVQDHLPFIQFSRALQAADPSELSAVVERYVDTDYMLRYLAVDSLLSNWDGITSFYCWSPNEGRCRNHNMYWYVDEPGEHFWLVPWDLDHTFQPNPEQETLVPSWRERPADCDRRIEWRSSLLMAPGCDPLLAGLAGLGDAAYQSALDEVLDGPFQVATLHAEIDRIVELIGPYVRNDPTVDYASWQDEVDELKEDIVTLRAKGERMR